METQPSALPRPPAGVRAVAVTGVASAAIAGGGFAARALYATPAYWFAMFSASMLGTNLGDFWVDRLLHDRLASFASLAVICGVCIWRDRRTGARTEAAYWAAIVGLRAAASNVADYLTHDLRLGYGTVTCVLGVAAFAGACFTRADPAKGNAPKVDGSYWFAMLIAGLFGTVGGDLTSHTIGLYAASAVSCGALLLLIAGRDNAAPGSILLYWCIVLAERCAGTAAGDTFASHRALGLGLPVAMACTGGLLVATLLFRARRAPA